MSLASSFRGSYFSIGNPILLLDRWINCYCHQRRAQVGDKQLLVKWTDRAEEALVKQAEPLIVEMQLYFSCVVKKRVLFHDQVDFKTQRVDDRLQVSFRSIEAARCDPEEFAKNYPVGRVLNSSAAVKMLPSWIGLDYRRGLWEGEFGFKK